jgi:putative transposase
MRYPASEKMEIIQLVEHSHLPVCRTLDKLGVPRPTFYRWYDRYQSGGPAALEDHRPQPDRVWNRIPDDIRDRVVKLALEEPTLSPRELGARFTDTEKYFRTVMQEGASALEKLPKRLTRIGSSRAGVLARKGDLGQSRL